MAVLLGIFPVPLIALDQLILKIVIHCKQAVHVLLELAVLFNDLLDTAELVLVVLDHCRLRVRIGLPLMRQAMWVWVRWSLWFFCDGELSYLWVVWVGTALSEAVRLGPHSRVSECVVGLLVGCELLMAWFWWWLFLQFRLQLFQHIQWWVYCLHSVISLIIISTHFSAGDRFIIKINHFLALIYLSTKINIYNQSYSGFSVSLFLIYCNLSLPGLFGFFYTDFL